MPRHACCNMPEGSQKYATLARKRIESHEFNSFSRRGGNEMPPESRAPEGEDPSSSYESEND